jgi:hypothetical protein
MNILFLKLPSFSDDKLRQNHKVKKKLLQTSKVHMFSSVSLHKERELGSPWTLAHDHVIELIMNVDRFRHGM